MMYLQFLTRVATNIFLEKKKIIFILLCSLLDKVAFQDSNQEKNNRVDLKIKIKALFYGLTR